MATSQLDRIVKGAPPPNVSPDQVASAARRASLSTSNSSSITSPLSPPLDPVSHLPSSPPQIYLNLLILEASLRAQYLSLRARLRLHVLLLGTLGAWTLSFTYLLFLRPREDGSGTGGSVYWVVDTMEKMAFVGGVVMWCLVWGTGIWDRGMRWPRRWVSVTNRGLRSFNLKVVVIKGSMWKEVLGYLTLLGPFGYWIGIKGMRYEYLPRDIERLSGGEKDRLKRLDSGRDHWVEEDIAPGGDTIKLLLLPKPFSPDFREEWDTYRNAYWEKENERRAVLRRLIKARDRELARRSAGWLWWTGWRGWPASRPKAPPPLHAKDKPAHVLLLQHQQARRRGGSESGSRHSRSSSRSSTPAPTPDPDHAGRPRKGTDASSTTARSRRTSSVHRSSVSGPAGARKKPPVRPSSRMSADGSRSSTPEAGAPRPLAPRRPASVYGSDSEAKKEKEDMPPAAQEVNIKEEQEE